MGEQSNTAPGSAQRKAELYASFQPPAWYVLRADRERRAHDDLLRRGIETWLPECRVVVSRRRKRTVIDGPLFPGYLFVRGVLTDDWLAAVLAVRDVESILRANGHPLAANEPQMDMLRRLVRESGGRVLIECGRVKRGYNTPIDEPVFKPGQQLRVVDGPFTSFLGLCKEQAGKARLKLMLDIFGRDAEVELDEASVELVA